MIKKDVDLIPDIQNPTPDYYCTWQTQLYATSGGRPKAQRAIMGESQLFGEENPYGWAYFYPDARRDLFIVMDDSWDVPLENEEEFYGSLILDTEKFPQSTGGAASNAEALGRLSERIRALGWKGLGGWVCAQESGRFFDGDVEKYWIQRLEDAEKSGFCYWKVDWGAKCNDIEFRRMLTELGRKHAPHLVIEHAMTKSVIPHSDVYRTYDVPAIMSVPMTMQKLASFATVGTAEQGYMGLVNCEDEVYIAAAGGFSMGIMRHPYVGEFPNGEKDRSFPEMHRNLKSKMHEVVRAARWHRIAPAFGIDKSNTRVSEQILSDYWRFEDKGSEIEQWWFKFPMIGDFVNGDVLTKTAPASVSRGCELPTVTPDENGNIPYTVASKNPNGVFSVVTLGRTFDRIYYIPKCNVSVDIGDSDTVGIFGEYKTVTLNTQLSGIKGVLMQDIAADEAYDVSEDVDICDGKIIISGELIENICKLCQQDIDTSEPAVAVKLIV